MAIWGAVIAAGASIASTLIAQAAAKKKQKQREEEMKKYGQFIEDSKNSSMSKISERADLQNAADALYSSIRERNQMASNPVSNLTPEEQANIRAQGGSDVKAYGQAVTGTAVGEAARIENNYQTAVGNLTTAKLNDLNQQSQNITNAGSQAASIFANAAGSFVNSGSGSGNANKVTTRAKTSDNSVSEAQNNKQAVDAVVNKGNANVGNDVGMVESNQRNLFDPMFG